MRIKVENTYHKTVKIVEAESLEKAKESEKELLQITANNLTPYEIEEDWELYYSDYDKAFTATYEGILGQLIEELEYTKLDGSF